MNAVTAMAPAKLNLTLGVGPRGADGYHPLSTVFQSIDLWDTVNVQLSDTPGVRISVTGRDAERVPLDETNLAARAAVALAQRLGVEPALEIEIEKSIPVAGGLAGGSADAAATLVACNELWRVGSTGRAGIGLYGMLALAASLGADVPFALVGGCALGTGRGERLERLATGAETWWIAITSQSGLSTPAIFAAWDRTQPGDGGAATAAARTGLGLARPVEMIRAIARGDQQATGRYLANDLQACAIAAAPEIAGRLDAMLEAGALGAVVTGSGPTVIGLADTFQAAQRIAAQVSQTEQLDAVIVGGAVDVGAHLA
ncbi:MAG: 4-(cytidine 5'-diphospho)-2-C-methyl-D-erythritol kinase [Bifidobacteriaceae bacterium]|jgi:4-diphosphocytidyl-2-C-methyl-D-erythritol kinase|nr:4-(cytidine 5'-diphospho)-2-C-methyl-D-erythritol kinase [Bifidobacteriaceae bacterium]